MLRTSDGRASRASGSTASTHQCSKHAASTRMSTIWMVHLPTSSVLMPVNAAYPRLSCSACPDSRPLLLLCWTLSPCVRHSLQASSSAGFFVCKLKKVSNTKRESDEKEDAALNAEEQAAAATADGGV
jgi:hypothetical protein